MMPKPTPTRATRPSASHRLSPSTRLCRAAGIVLAAVVPAAGAAGAARAGAVLVSRDSYIRATGGPASGSAGAFAPFDLSNGTTGFDRFADDVSNAAGGSDGSGGSDPVVSE